MTSVFSCFRRRLRESRKRYEEAERRWRDEPWNPAFCKCRGDALDRWFCDYCMDKPYA